MVELVEALSLMADHTRFPSESMQLDVKQAITDALTVPEPLTDDNEDTNGL